MNEGQWPARLPGSWPGLHRHDRPPRGDPHSRQSALARLGLVPRPHKCGFRPRPGSQGSPAGAVARSGRSRELICVRPRSERRQPMAVTFLAALRGGSRELIPAGTRRSPRDSTPASVHLRRFSRPWWFVPPRASRRVSAGDAPRVWLLVENPVGRPPGRSTGAVRSVGS